MGVDVTIYEGRELRTFQNVQKLQTSGGQLWIPEEEADNKLLSVISDYFTRLWGEVDLSGTRWTLGSNISVYPIGAGATFNVNFTSNSISFTALAITVTIIGASIHTILIYSNSGGDTQVYDNGVWVNDAYKTIQIEDGADVNSAKLLGWLYNNDITVRSTQEDLEMCLQMFIGEYRRRYNIASGMTIENAALSYFNRS